MSSLFWWRKNKRLEERLSNVVERSEEVKKVYEAPKQPRVVIDTSYLDETTNHDLPLDDPGEDAQSTAAPRRPARALAESHGEHEDSSVNPADFDQEMIPLAEVEALITSLETELAAERQARLAAEGRAETRLQSITDYNEPDVAGLQDANAQLADAIRRANDIEFELNALREVAEQDQVAAQRTAVKLKAEAQRELAARAEADAQREKALRRAADLERELNALRKDAERAKSASEAEAAARAEADAQRKLLTQVKADAASQQSALQETKDALAEATERISTLDSELAELRLAAKEVAAAARRDLEAREAERAARDDADAQRELAAGFKAEAERETKARLAAETIKDEAVRHAAELERNNAMLRREAEDEAAVARSALESRETELRTDANAQRELVAKYSQRAEREQEARLSAELERDEAVARANKLERELVAIRETSKSDTESATREVRDAETAARKDADTQRELAKTFAAQAGNEHEARLSAEAERDSAMARIADCERELAQLREHRVESTGVAAGRAEIERKLTEATQTIASQRDQIERLNKETAAANSAKENDAEADAERKARIAAESQRDAALAHAAKLENQLSALRESQTQTGAAHRAEIERQLYEAVQTISAQREQIDRLNVQFANAQSVHQDDAKVEAETEARIAAETLRDAAMVRIAEVEDELAALRASSAKGVGSAEHRAEIERQLYEAVQTISVLREQIARLTNESMRARSAPDFDPAALDHEISARLAAVEERDQAVARADALARELTQLREASGQTAKPSTQHRKTIDMAAIAAADSPVPMRASFSAPPAQLQKSKIDRSLADAVGSAVPMRAKNFESLVKQTEPVPAKPAAVKPPPLSDEEAKQRKDKRVESQTPATIWRQGMSEAAACVIRDKSSSGAMIEMPASKFGESGANVGVGDKVTLSITLSREVSSVACVVMWVEGRRAGVRFTGPFHTQVVKARKSLRGN